MKTINTDVIIIGAGPTGLSLACQLIRYGIDFVVTRRTRALHHEEIEQEIKDQAKLSLDISDVRWFSLYKVHSRRVNKFSEGRCFLAGDSDNHIAFISSEISLNGAREYLNRIAGR